MAASSSLAVLAVAAAAAGFALACIHPVNSAVVADVVPTERRGQAYGILYQALGLGWFLGPLVAAPFLAAGGYRVVFAVVAGAVALAGSLLVGPAAAYAVFGRVVRPGPPRQVPAGTANVEP